MRNRSVHILMISDVYFPRVNGVSTSIMTFRQRLQGMGHRVTLIVPNYPVDQSKWSDDDLIRIPSRGLPMDPEDRMMKMGEIINACNKLEGPPVDILHIQTPFVAHYAGIKIAEGLNIPTVISYHTFFEEYLFHYIPFLPKKLMKFAARHFTRSQCKEVSGLIVPSNAMLSVLRDYGVATPAEVLPTGIEEHCFTPSNAVQFKQKHGITADRPTLVHVGRVAHEKNIGFLLETLALIKIEVPDVLMIIAGEGPALNSLKAKAVKLNLKDNVLFIGYLERQHELPACYSAGDVFIFASRTETQGLVLLEAMAQGVPAVSTAVMGTKDIINPEKGSRRAEENTEQFSQTVISLLANETLRKQLSEEAMAFAREWSAPVLAEQLVIFYQKQNSLNQ